MNQNRDHHHFIFLKLYSYKLNFNWVKNLNDWN